MTDAATTVFLRLPAAAAAACGFGRMGSLLTLAVLAQLALATGAQAAPPATLVATPAAPSIARDAAAETVQRIDDYAAAKEAAQIGRAHV